MPGGDGAELSKDALAAGVSKLGYKLLRVEVDMLFRQLDVLDKGSVSRAAVVDLLSQKPSSAASATSAPTNQRSAPAAVVDIVARVKQLLGGSSRFAVETVFKSFDTNRSGKLSRAELKAGLLQLGHHLSEPEMSALMAHYDTNGSGLITLSEFVRGVTKDELDAEPPSKWWQGSSTQKPKLSLTASHDSELPAASLPSMSMGSDRGMDSFLAAEADAKAASMSVTASRSHIEAQVSTHTCQ